MPATQAKPKFPSFTAKVKESIKADPRYKNLLSCINRNERLETVLDANYMSTNCGKDGKEAEAYVEELDKTYGYKAVAKFLTAEAYI
jgi:hypothetical protein